MSCSLVVISMKDSLFCEPMGHPFDHEAFSLSYKLVDMNDFLSVSVLKRLDFDLIPLIPKELSLNFDVRLFLAKPYESSRYLPGPGIYCAYLFSMKSKRKTKGYMFANDQFSVALCTLWAFIDFSLHS